MKKKSPSNIRFLIELSKHFGMKFAIFYVNIVQLVFS